MHETGMTVSFAGLFALGLVATLALGVLFGLIAAIRHKKWGLLLLGGAFTILSLITMAGVFVGYASVERTAQNQTARLQATTTTTKAKPVSDTELIAVAAAKPRIELEDQAAVEAEPEANDAEEIALEPPAEPRPDWVTADLKANQHRFTAGPFTTVEQCRADARVQLNDWVWEATRLRQPDFGPEPPASWSDAITEITDRFGKEEHLEKRQTSVGEVYLLHTLAELDDENHGWLDDHVELWTREAQRTRGMRAVVLGGGVVVGLLGCGHLLLRGGQRSEKEPA